MTRFRLRLPTLAAVFAFVSFVSGARAIAAAPTDASMVSKAGHMTLAEFARARMTSRFAAAPRAVPEAWLTPGAAAAAGRHLPDVYLLYASAASPSGLGFVNIYLAGLPGASPPLVGRISGLDSPAGLAVDKAGTLYVTQVNPGAPVLVFPLGATRPSLRLDTLGTIAVAVAVSDQGNVIVSTATADVFVYRRGATEPALHYSSLAGDGVQAVQTDVDGNIYFAGNYFSNGTTIGEITPRKEITLGHFADHTNGLVLDSNGNALTVRSLNKLYVYAHHTARLLRVLPVVGFQSLTLNNVDSTVYTATGTINAYAYPSGKYVGKISGLENYETFGLATFPASPLPPPQ